MVVRHNSERGQALILITLGIIGLLGFAALAIDGGRVYIDRRSMQNASDTGSLSGGLAYTQYFAANGIHYNSGWDCASIQAGAAAQAKDAAIARALSNGFAIDDTVDETNGDFNGVRSTCVIEDFGGFQDKYIDLETFVTDVTPSSFAQFMFGGPLQQTVLSISRVHPQTTLGFGAAIVALNDQGCQGMQNGALFDGSSSVHVTGGGIISNGCIRKTGSGDILVDPPGSISYGEEYQLSGGAGSVSPSPGQSNGNIPDYAVSIPEPNCSGLTNFGNSSGSASLQPGVYTNITLNGTDTLQLAPGLYCITDDFRANAQSSVHGDGVTLYIINGEFSTSGGAEVALSAPAQGSGAAPAIEGILIYLARGNTNDVILVGNSDSNYEGSVYAPDGTIEVGGTGDLDVVHAQLIGWNVFVHGNATIDIVNDDSINHQIPPNISLQR